MAAPLRPYSFDIYYKQHVNIYFITMHIAVFILILSNSLTVDVSKFV